MSKEIDQPTAMDKEDQHALKHLLETCTEEIATTTDPKEGISLHNCIAFCCCEFGLPVPELTDVAPLLELDGVDVAAIRAELEMEEEAAAARTRQHVRYLVAKEKGAQTAKQYGFLSPQHVATVIELLRVIPPDERAPLMSKAVEQGLLPKADGYTADGEPVYAVETLAKHFAISPEEAIKAATPDLVLSPQAIHSVH